MKSKLQLGLLLTALCFIASGCATVTRGTKDTLVVESEPAGANVRLSNGMTGKTPTSFTLPRKESVLVTIEKEGYETLSVNVHPQISGAGAAGMAGNVLVGGLIGAVVDPMTGAMKDLRPNPVKATLVPLKPAVPTVAIPPGAEAKPASAATAPAAGAPPTAAVPAAPAAKPDAP